MPSASINIPAWRSRLNECISKSMKENKDSISYAFSTIENGEPRCRFVVHRGFVNERRKEGDPSENDASEEFTSNVLLTSTDARGPKAEQLRALEGKGCPCEIAWWLEPVKMQFRIKGHAFLFGPSNNDNFPSKRLSPSHPSKSSSSSSFSWEDERVRIYDKHSPTLKASFLRPTPGTPMHKVDGGGAKLEDYPQELKEDQKDEMKKALERFAIIAIDPWQVDAADLGSMPNRRIIYTKKDNDQWTEEEVAP